MPEFINFIMKNVIEGFEKYFTDLQNRVLDKILQTIAIFY